MSVGVTTTPTGVTLSVPTVAGTIEKIQINTGMASSDSQPEQVAEVAEAVAEVETAVEEQESESDSKEEKQETKETKADKKKIIDDILSSIVDKKNIQGDALKMWEAKGCSECNGTGYKGRIGIFEAIIMDESIEALVKKSASEREISDASISQGLLTIKQDGILKVLKGMTSFDELRRVVEL